MIFTSYPKQFKLTILAVDKQAGLRGAEHEVHRVILRVVVSGGATARHGVRAVDPFLQTIGRQTLFESFNVSQ